MGIFRFILPTGQVPSFHFQVGASMQTVRMPRSPGLVHVILISLCHGSTARRPEARAAGSSYHCSVGSDEKNAGHSVLAAATQNSLAATHTGHSVAKAATASVMANADDK